MYLNLIPCFLAKTQTTVPDASIIVSERGNRKVNRTFAFLGNSGTSTWIPFLLMFHVTPRKVRSSAIQITWARIGTRTCFRRFCNTPPMDVRARSQTFSYFLRGEVECTP